MAYVLKSDVVVNDPTNKFPFLTCNGFTFNKELKTYSDALKNKNYILTKNDFDALDGFISEMKTEGLWGSVKLCAPFIGDSIDTALTVMSGNAMRTINDNGDGLNLEARWDNVNGKYLGIKRTDNYYNSNAPALDTGLTVGDVGQNWTVSMYIDTANTLNVDNRSLVLFGASLDNNATKQCYAELVSNTNMASLQMANRGGKKSGGSLIDGSGVIVCTARTQELSANWNDILVNNSISGGYEYPLSESEPFYLLAKKPFSGSVMQGFNGALRFALITDVYSDGDKKQRTSVKINALMKNLNKQF